MKDLFTELVAKESALLISGNPPSGKAVFPEKMVDLICHHDLGALGSFWAGKSSGWQRLLSGKALATLDQNVIKSKIRYKMVFDSLVDANEILSVFRPLLFKGLSLCELYPKPFLRNPGDIDLIIDKKLFLDACEVLEKNGWRIQNTIHRNKNNDIADDYGFARVYRHPDRPVIIDLHRAPIDKTEPFWIETEALYEHSIQNNLSDGPVVSNPGMEEHLALIALHSVRHGTFRLSWCLDVHLACTAWQATIDVKRFEDFCRRWNILRAVYVGLEVSKKLFNTSWHPLEHIRLDKRTHYATKRRSPGIIAHGHLYNSGSFRRVGAMIDLMENNRLILKYCKKMMFPQKSLLVNQDDKEIGLIRYLLSRITKLSEILK